MNPLPPKDLARIATNDDVIREVRAMRAHFDAGQTMALNHIKALGERVQGVETRIGRLESRVDTAETHRDYTTDSIRQGSEVDMKLASDLSAVVNVVQAMGRAQKERQEETNVMIAKQGAYLHQIHDKVVPAVFRAWWRNHEVWKVFALFVAALAGAFLGKGLQ